MVSHIFLSKTAGVWHGNTCPDTLVCTHIKKFTPTEAGKAKTFGKVLGKAAAPAEDGKSKKHNLKTKPKNQRP
jgi:hypothetical protein